jgi:acetate kinase
VTAVRDGCSVDTTMGLTPLEGVPMATRAGSVDPGALLFLLRRGLTVDELDRALEHDSGLLGLSGSASVREIEGAADDASRLAFDVFSYRVAGAIAAATVALGGLDAVAFTAGIGENSALVRRLVCGRLAHLGLELDEAANAAAEPDAEIARAGSVVRIVVLHAREDLVAARAARDLLGL